MSIINVYTDGSLTKKQNKAYCGYGIYFSNHEYKDISRRFTHEPITNNRAELYAILKAIILTRKINLEKSVKMLNIYSDSEYSVKSINIWLPTWKKTNKKYLNKDLIDLIDEHIKNAPFTIKIIHINSHTNNNDIHSINNDKADKLAKAGAFREI